MAPGEVARRYSPRRDVTILRDKAHAVPHVYGSTREGLMFGIGYATAEDRLFFIDVLRHLGRGRQVQRDAEAYVAGINAYIAEAKLDPLKMPGEYAAIGRPLGPDPWKQTDIIATAALVGGIFGKGGGEELS